MGEITQEQVERLKAGAKARTAGPADVLGREWRSLLPDYVAEAWAASWERDGAGDLNNRVYPAALERWLATFPVTPAPDPVRDVERMADPVPTADEARSALDVAFGERWLAPIGDWIDAALASKQPQPETWHDRLVRLARDLEAAEVAHGAALDRQKLADRDVDAAYRDLRAARGALADATEASAILAAGGGK